MNQKLTLSIEQQVITQGKLYAKQQGRSLSSLVESFLLSLGPADVIEEEIPISAQLSSLVGIGTGATTEEDYRAHRIAKADA